LGVIRSTNHALVDQHLLTIGRIRKFFALLFSSVQRLRRKTNANLQSGD